MLHGSMVALVTPMSGDGEIDWDSLESLIDWHLEQGTHAIVAVGTTGESATLNIQEHVDVIRFVVKQVAGRIPVVAGTGANSIHEAMELTQGAKDANADACLLVTPYYNKPTQEGLYLHHRYIAEQVAIPQILYNVPGRTAVDMQADTVARLAEVDNIIGIKDATADMDRLKEMQSKIDGEFLYFSGDDETALQFMQLGGHGEISVTANIAPKLVADMCEFIAKGDLSSAQQIDERLAPLNRVLFLESNPIPVKWALAQMGKVQQSIRLPLTHLSEPFQAQVLVALEQVGAL